MIIFKHDFNSSNRLDEVELKKIIQANQMNIQEFIEQEKYLQGEDCEILNRKMPDNAQNVPDNRVAVPYGRKIIKTIASYLYRPGYINTTFEDESENELFKNIYKENDETLKDNILGTYTCANGICYELHYLSNEMGIPKNKFAVIKAKDGIPIFDYSIEPDMRAFIRLYEINGVCYYEIYYIDEIQTWYSDKNGKFIMADFMPNVFKTIPVVIYKNNNEYKSDITIIKKLIDAYDILMSDSLNEFDRFAWAYLKIFGMKIDEDDAKAIKNLRIFQNLDKDVNVEFLTKDIPTQYIQYMADWIRKEIHRQSFIPDIEDVNFGGSASGIAIDKFVYMMEYIASEKEAFFRDALEERIEMIRRIEKLKQSDIENNYNYEIVFKRNIPNSDLQNSQIYINYYQKGISTETLISNFAPFVKDAAKEIEKSNAEQESKLPNLDDLQTSNDNQMNIDMNNQDMTQEEKDIEMAR